MTPLPPIAYDDIPFPVIVSQYETGLIVEMNSAAKHVFNNIRKGLTIDALFPSLGSLNTKEGFKAAVLEGVSESSRSQWHVQRKSLKHKGSLLNVDFCMSLGTLAAVETGLDVPSNDLPSSRAAIIKDRDLSDAIINSLPGIFYLFNQEGKFLRWNRNFQQVSGYSAEEIATEITPLDLFEENEKKLVAARIHEVFVSGTATVEANFYTKRRERIPHYFSGSAIDFEGEMCLIGMGIDITFRKEAEQEVRSKTKMIDLKALSFYTDECRPLISNAIESCVANGEWYDLTLQIITKLGKKKWVRTVGLSERVNGRAVKLYGLFQDIDKEKVKEHELARLALIAQRTNNLIVITGADRTIQWVNEAFIRLTGYSMEEAIGQSPGALLQGPSTDAGTVRRVSRKLNAGEAVHFEILNYRKDGEKYWLEVDIQPVYNHKNELDYFIAIQSDITQRKQAIDTLRESEQRFRLMADSAPVMIWMASSDKLYYYFNKGWYAFTGRTMSQELAFGWMDSIHLDDVDRVRQIQGEAFDLQNEFKIEYRLLNSHGEYRWIVDHGIPRIMSDGMFVGYIGTCFDIHDRKRAEESLQFTRFTIEHFSDPVLWTDSEGFFIDFNKQAHDILGYTAEEFSKLNVSDLAVNFTQATWNQHWEDLRAHKSLTIGTEHKRKDGSIIEVEINANHLIYKGREYNCAFIHDVTQRRKAEQRLLESEERFRKLISDLQVGVVLQDINSKIILTNKIAITLLGLPEDQLLGKSSFDSDWDFVHSDCSVFTGEAHPVPTAIRTREPVRGVVMGILRKGEEQRVWLQVDAHPVLNDAQEIVHVICTFMDITELRAHQQSLQRGLNEKEVLIKEIHHRVKNNLQLISSILYIRMSNMEQSDIRDFLENTRQKIRSISLIHERLLQTGSLHDVDIEDYLNKLLEDLAMSNTRPNLFVQMDIRIEPEMVGLDMAIYFGLIINELVTNAIKHAFSESAHGSILIHMQKRGTGHELIVGDDGSTLPEHITIGQKGSFGMQLLEIFIKQINGTVTIDRKNGTTFTIITT